MVTAITLTLSLTLVTSALISSAGSLFSLASNAEASRTPLGMPWQRTVVNRGASAKLPLPELLEALALAEPRPAPEEEEEEEETAKMIFLVPPAAPVTW